MKKVLAPFFGLLFLAAPALAFADDFTPLLLQVKQLTAILAGIKVQERVLAGETLACAVVTSTVSVRENEPFVLAWSSYGAMSPGDDETISMWAPNDASVVSIPKQGLWTYRLTFYAKNGATKTCSAQIAVTSA